VVARPDAVPRLVEGQRRCGDPAVGARMGAVLDDSDQDVIDPVAKAPGLTDDKVLERAGEGIV
jgi:hypothetical protein